MNNFHNKKSRIIWQWIILAISTTILLYVVYLTVDNFETLRLRGYIHPLHRFHSSAGLSPSSPNDIQAWMTFYYINLEFKLPPDYLKSSLNVTDNKYPNVSLNKLAKETKTAPTKVLAKTETAIENYINQNQPAKK